ncbi:28282_t:CDS:2 [Racocetra persica]|uniref:28282_t:CDS:1 n=1 Tax=Racocetra persica TaxID=160502 RepID=A0ACA9QBN5_9GLOM|nr:28282_t:CDS:2 [Racocetra persica]
MTRKIKLTTEIIKKVKEEGKNTIQVVDRTPPLSKSLRPGILQKILKDGKLFCYVNPDTDTDKNDCQFISQNILQDFQNIFDGEKKITKVKKGKNTFGYVTYSKNGEKKVKDLTTADIIRPASPEAFKFLQATIAGEVKVIYGPREYDLAEFEGVENLADMDIQVEVAEVNSQPQERENDSSETNENNNDKEQTNEQHSSSGSNSLQEIEIILDVFTGEKDMAGQPVAHEEKMMAHNACYTIEPVEIKSLDGERTLIIDTLVLRFRTCKEVEKIQPDRLLAVDSEIQIELAPVAAKSEQAHN